jgi:hypothetical protein
LAKFSCGNSQLTHKFEGKKKERNGANVYNGYQGLFKLEMGTRSPHYEREKNSKVTIFTETGSKMSPEQYRTNPRKTTNFYFIL